MANTLQRGNNMNKKLKTVNRGIVLGIILIIAVVISVIVDNYRFQSEKDYVREQLDKYLNEYTTAMVQEGTSSSADADSYKKLSSIVNNYWCDKTVSLNNWNYTLSDMVNNLTSINDSENKEETEAYIVSSTYKTSNTRISKSGPNFAKISCSIVYTVETSGPMTFMCPLFPSEYSGSYDYSDSNKDDHIASKDTHFLNTIDCDYVIYMYRDSGTWKICETSINGYSYNSQTIDKEAE